jgi:hypothetical protein
MRVVISIKFIVFILILSGCSKSDNSQIKPEKKIIFSAFQKFTDFNKITRTFTIFEDSTYIFTENIVDEDHNKIENWKGKTQIINDTLKFFPFRLKYNRSEFAVLKNGFVEFIDGEYPDRMKIKKTSLTVKNFIDFNNFKDYSVFTFYNNFKNSPDEKDFKNQNLTTDELIKIDNILKQTFKENKKARDFKEYFKQVESFKSKSGENIIYIHCFCKDTDMMENYEYYLTSRSDGGNCNIFIQLNLTSGKIEVLNIAGMS